MKIISLLLLIYVSINYTSFSQDSLKTQKLNKNETESYSKAIKEFKDLYNKSEDELKKYKHFNRWNHFWGKRINSEGSPDIKEIMREIKLNEAKERQNKLLTSNINWEAFGPFNSPVNDEGLGRINVIEFHPNNTSIIYIGSATGGAWVTTNKGQTWSILPTTDYLSLSISDIEISKNNPNIIYISTSDANAANGVNGPVYGIGVLKSTDGGKSFNPTDKFYRLDERFFTSSLEIHPDNDNIVWVGTDRGVYKTTDGGLTFVNLGPNMFVKDIELHPTNPDIVYITSHSRQQEIARVYRSENGGEDWELAQSYGDAVRAEIAITPANPDRIVSLVSQDFPYSFHSLNVSDDAGKTWEIMSDSTNPNILGRSNGDYPPVDASTPDQGWYDLCVGINPTNDEEIITGGIWLWESMNSGGHFTEIVDDYHVDQHYIKYVPTGDTVYIANDGGLYRYIPKSNSMQFVSEGMNITQYYKFSVNHENINMVVAGSQDNNSMLKRANGNWYNVRGGDGMDCHFDPKDPNYVYVSSQYGNFGYSTNGGDNFRQSISRFNTDGEEGDWVTPFAVDPQKTGYVYVGYYNVWRNTNHGARNDWEKISDFGTNSPLEILSISKSNSDYIYCSEGGSIRITTNGGDTWSLLPNPGGNVTDIEVHPTIPDKIYVTISNYIQRIKVFEYDPVNKKWNNLSGNLPNVPINTIRYQENSPDRLFVGTDIGVYYTDYNSRYWERYGKGLPYTLVSDIDIMEDDIKIFISTYGRGIWSADLIDCNYAELQIDKEGENEFCRGDSIKLIYNGSFNDPNEIRWSTGETGLSIWVKEEGSYSVARKVSDNCTAKSNFIEINLRSTVDVNLRSSKGDTICVGDSTRLSANFGQREYIWDDGTTGLSKWVKEPGTYSIKVLNNNGCYSFDTITISQRVIEKPEITLIDSVLEVNTNSFVQWYFNGEFVDGANSSTFKPEIDGEVFVEVRQSGCSEFSEVFFYNVNSVDLSDFVKIYPNPSNGEFSIELSEPNLIQDISIFDINGINVYSKSNYLKNRLDLKLNGLSNGSYIMKLKINNQIYSTKIVINR